MAKILSVQTKILIIMQEKAIYFTQRDQEGQEVKDTHEK